MPHLSTKKMIMICCHPERRFLSSLGSWRNTLNHSFCFIWNDGCLCSSFLFWERKYLFFLRPQLIDDFLIVKKTLISFWLTVQQVLNKVSEDRTWSSLSASKEAGPIILVISERWTFASWFHKEMRPDRDRFRWQLPLHSTESYDSRIQRRYLQLL